MTAQQGNADLIADYLGEAHDYLEQLSKVLLQLAEGDGNWPQERVVELFRSAHSLKGLSACFGFEKTNQVTHELENLLVLVRDGKVHPHPGLVKAMFAAIDMVSHLTAEIASGGHEHTETGVLLQSLKGAAASKALPAAGPRASAGEPARAASAPGNGNAEANETVRVRMDRLDRMVNLTGELVITRSRLHLVTRQMRPLQRAGELFATAAELQHGLQALECFASVAGAHGPALLRLQEQLTTYAQVLHGGLGDLQGIGRVLRELDETTYDLDGAVGGIHEAVLQLRMVPLDSVFRRLQRVVRDTAEVVGKSVALEIAGGDTQIDKRVADELINPLVHILRNAVDHGIEVPTERTAAGKPAQGTVRVSAFQRGSSVVIEVRDDGRGIDPQRLLAKAVEKGILTAEEAAATSPAAAQRLIFAPGFSTAAAVTEVSGRGMGMDIVLSTIKALRGSLDLESHVGSGSRFTIQLPPSMSILSSLLIEVRGTMFALPLTEVREIVELPRLRQHVVQGRPTIVVRDQPMPLVRLGATYRFPGEGLAGPEVEPQHAVLFGSGEMLLALAVDRLLGKEDLVLKPLCSELQRVPGLAGMAIRGDGRVTLILDPVGYAEHALGRRRVRPKVEEPEPCPSAP
jgi:two-component system chemotaxis sensor kinase CheA